MMNTGTVAGILSIFTKLVAKLEVLIERREAKRVKALDRSEELKEEALGHGKEIAAAQRAITKIKGIYEE